MRTYQHLLLLLIILVVVSGCIVTGSAQADSFPNNLLSIFGGQTSSQPNESQGSNITMIPTATFENGKRYETNGLIITELHGNYREMGRQYGDLYRKELAEIDNTLKTDFVKVPGITVDVMQQKGQVLFDAYPQRYKEIMNGMAETSNISLEDIKMINAMELYIPAVASGWTGCSGFAAWGPYTTDGKLIFGRNYDYSPVMTNYTTVTVWNSDDGSIPVATIGYTGLIYLSTGMNKEKQFLQLNMGANSGGSFRRTDRVIGVVSLFSILQDAATPQQIYKRLQSENTDTAYVINTASPSGGVPYEWSTWTLKQRAPDRDGILVGTNHFVDPSWGLAPPEAHSIVDNMTGESAWRRENLLSFADKNKGSITIEKVKNVMATPLEGGGVFLAPDTTSYQIVAVPDDLRIWVRVPQRLDWTQVDLMPLFG
jgi:hypothetical protein